MQKVLCIGQMREETSTDYIIHTRRNHESEREMEQCTSFIRHNVTASHCSESRNHMLFMQDVRQTWSCACAAK